MNHPLYSKGLILMLFQAEIIAWTLKYNSQTYFFRLVWFQVL
jgi:hypothetical protein